MKNKEIFKEGDIVYHWMYGKGEVVKIKTLNITYSILVGFVGAKQWFTSDGRHTVDEPTSLSFTPYDLVNGGFSQERPLPDIEVDTLVYVRDGMGDAWQMRYFSHFNNAGIIKCFKYQKRSIETEDTIIWAEYSLTNPLEK